MVNLYYFFLLKYIFEFNFFFYFFFIILSLLILFFSKFFNLSFVFKNLDSRYIVKIILLSSSFVSFFCILLSFLIFIKSISNINYTYIFFNSENYFSNYVDIFFLKLPLFSIHSIKFSIDFFGFIFIILAYFVGFISFLSLDIRFFWGNMRFIFTCNLLIFNIYIFIMVDDLLLFFLFYEFLLIPSFIFVYCVSPYRRGVQASLYFLIWTQLGSLLVLSAISYIFYNIGSSSFYIYQLYKFTLDEVWWLFFLFFFGFGFKVPIWPFQYWLTKTHVEAPAGFSIFLSGFLVKTAVYGFFKLTNLIGVEVDTYFFSIFTLMGIVDASIKMWAQIDLKKLVAYCTVQEMNIIYIAFLYGDYNLYIGGLFFCITHALLSILMFYLVDCIQRRFGTRVISEISGILHLTPNLGISIIFMQIFYSGLPGTLKFFSEFYVFSSLFYSAPSSIFFIIFVANFLGLLGFSKCWFNVIFGLNLSSKKKLPDLTQKEFFIIFFCFFFLFFVGISINLFF